MSNAVSSELKETIRQSFKKACLLRLEGKETQAVQILQEELPVFIKKWQTAGDVTAQQIEDFFAAELARTENSHWIVTKLLQRMQPQFESLQSATQAEAMQNLLNAKMQLGFDSLKERLQKITGELLTYQGAEALGSRVSQELSTRVKNAVAESLNQIESSIAKFVTQESLADQVATLKVSLSDQIRALVDSHTTPETIAQIVREQIAQHDANVSALASKIDDLKENTGEAISQRTQEGVASEIAALEQRQAQQMGGLKAAVSEVVAQQIDKQLQAIAEQTQEIAQLDQKTSALGEQVGSQIAQSSAALTDTVERILGESFDQLAKREDFRGVLSKEALETALNQSQTLLLQNLENQKRQMAELVNTRMSRVDSSFTDLKVALVKRMEGMVSAETFEGRLMATANMMAEAQSKALAETAEGLASLLDKRLAESTGPIYQRISSVLTVSDWERMTRELNEKFLGRIEGSVATRIEETFKQHNDAAAEMAATLTHNMKQAQGQLSELSSGIDSQLSSIKGALDDSSKVVAERLATLYIENAQQQTDMLNDLQKTLSDNQSHAIGSLTASQQSFMASVRKENEQLAVTIGHMAARQEAIEQAQDQIAATLKAFDKQMQNMATTFAQVQSAIPQTLQGLEKSMQARLADAATANQAQIATMADRLEKGINEGMSKRLENIRLVVK